MIKRTLILLALLTIILSPTMVQAQNETTINNEKYWPEEPIDNPFGITITFISIIFGIPFFFLLLMIPPPNRRRKKVNSQHYTKPKKSDSIFSLLNKVRRARESNKPIKSVKDPIKTEHIYGSNIDQEYIENFREQHRLKTEFLSQQTIDRKALDAIQLPDLSSPNDNEDWRSCPFCGEWNKSDTKRCTHCDGRLGRPLS